MHNGQTVNYRSFFTGANIKQWLIYLGSQHQSAAFPSGWSTLRWISCLNNKKHIFLNIQTCLSPWLREIHIYMHISVRSFTVHDEFISNPYFFCLYYCSGHKESYSAPENHNTSHSVSIIKQVESNKAVIGVWDEIYVAPSAPLLSGVSGPRVAGGE